MLTIQRQIAAYRHGHAVANAASREQHWYIPAALLYINDGENDQTKDGHHQEEHPPAVRFVSQDSNQLGWNTGDDTGKDDQRKTLIGDTKF